ncbi:MAG: hypothetical protein Q6L60_00840 [Thermostichus sp. HHBFW_bins_43]
MSARSQPKPCQYCGQAVRIRYRIRWDATGRWWLVCPACWDPLSRDNPFYRYGGTWKARG